MMLPRGIRWWLVPQRQLSFHLSPLPVSLAHFVFPFFHLYVPESQQNSLIANKSHTTHRYALTQRQLSCLLVSLGGPAVAAPSQRRVCVIVCVSVYWAWLDQFLLILVHRITARLSQPITAWDCWRTQPASVRVCVWVCVAHLLLCHTDATSHKYPLVTWLAWRNFYHIRGKSYCSWLSQYHRISHVTILLLSLNFLFFIFFQSQ